MRYLKYSILLVFVGLFSCDLGNDPKPTGTEVQAMAGEWYTTFTIDGDDVYGLGYQLITTSNTAANTASEFLIKDDNHTWNYMIKAPVNMSELTFGGSGLTNLAYNIKATITEGKVLQQMATSPGGSQTDSIHFKIEFTDDPGTIYTVAGYRRTGFQEDEQ